jgi:hypothetical protein
VRSPFLLGIIDVIAIPRLTRFFGARLLHLGACATAKARDNEEGEKTDDFEAEVCVFHFFLVSQRWHNVVTHAFRSSARCSEDQYIIAAEGNVSV